MTVYGGLMRVGRWFRNRPCFLYLVHLDHADPLAVASVVVDELSSQNLCCRGWGDVTMVAEELCFPLLPLVPALEPGMRGLVLGGENQRYIEI